MLSSEETIESVYSSLIAAIEDTINSFQTSLKGIGPENIFISSEILCIAPIGGEEEKKLQDQKITISEVNKGIILEFQEMFASLNLSLEPKYRILRKFLEANSPKKFRNFIMISSYLLMKIMQRFETSDFIVNNFIKKLLPERRIIISKKLSDIFLMEDRIKIYYIFLFQHFVLESKVPRIFFNELDKNNAISRFSMKIRDRMIKIFQLEEIINIYHKVTSVTPFRIKILFENALFVSFSCMLPKKMCGFTTGNLYIFIKHFNGFNEKQQDAAIIMIFFMNLHIF